MNQSKESIRFQERALQVKKMWKGACQVVRGFYFRGVQREDCSLFLSLTQPLSIKKPSAFLWESLLRGCGSLPLPFLTLPAIQERKKKAAEKTNRETRQPSVYKCRNTPRNKIRSYGTTEGTIFFMLLSAFSTMTSSEEAAAKTIWCL